MPASAAPVGPAPVSDKLARWTLQQRPPQTAEEHVGKLFAGRYLLRDKIGSGGMSTIYEAQDTTLGVRVVIKIMRGDLPGDPVDRFRREAHVLAGLQHEHIARIIDRQDPDEGPRFHVTDYIDGINLSALRRRGPVPAAVVVQLGLQASAALAYAHSAGVIHRDIKPSNMMLVRHPGGDIFVRVIDFGIAKLTRGSDLAAPNHAPAGARRETRGDVVVGTAPYWCGHEGPRRDVYALALTLAELLTGEAPNASVDLARDHIPPALARCITAVLRSDEIVTMDALHAALREAEAQAPGEAEPERRRYVARILANTPAAAVDKAPDVVPRFAGRYIFAGDLGQGGMGRVRTAFDTLHQRGRAPPLGIEWRGRPLPFSGVLPVRRALRQVAACSPGRQYLRRPRSFELTAREARFRVAGRCARSSSPPWTADEYSQVQDSRVWTGTLADGQPALGSEFCGDWDD